MTHPADAAVRVREILDELNDHDADAWDEVVYALPEYDEAKSRTIYQGVGGAFVALNTIFRYDVEDGWIIQDFGGNETYVP